MIASRTKRKRLLWVSLILVAAAIAFWYPFVDRRSRIFFAERALRARKADLALVWLKSIPAGQSDAHREFLMARAYRRLGQLDLVREHLQRAFDLRFPFERLQREEWMAMAQSGQMRDAEPHLRELLQNPGEDGQEICESYVSGYFRNRQVWKAMPIVDAWQADFPDDPLPYSIRGGRFRELEKWPEAIAEYKKALELTPEDTHIRLQLAICLKAAVKFDDAEVEFRQCLKETPQDKSLLAEWGDLLLSIGKTSEATAVFEQLLAADPKNPDARSALGGILLKNGKAIDAVAMLKPLYSERPYDMKVQYAYASALQAAGNSEMASVIFNQVATAETQLRRKRKLMEELDPSASQVDQRFEIAMIAMNHESPDEGIRWLMSVIDLDPGYAPAYAALADYYQKTGNAELEQKYRIMAESKSKAASTP
jgi:predicted Zn-dependent protease